MYRKKPLASAISCILGAGSVLAVNAALAQEDATVDGIEEEQIENIIVTGSRIKRDSFSSASPMDVVLTDAAVARAASRTSAHCCKPPRWPPARRR